MTPGRFTDPLYRPSPGGSGSRATSPRAPPGRVTVSDRDPRAEPWWTGFSAYSPSRSRAAAEALAPGAWVRKATRDWPDVSTARTIGSGRGLHPSCAGGASAARRFGSGRGHATAQSSGAARGSRGRGGPRPVAHGSAWQWQGPAAIARSTCDHLDCAPRSPAAPLSKPLSCVSALPFVPLPVHRAHGRSPETHCRQGPLAVSQFGVDSPLTRRLEENNQKVPDQRSSAALNLSTAMAKRQDTHSISIST